MYCFNSNLSLDAVSNTSLVEFNMQDFFKNRQNENSCLRNLNNQVVYYLRDSNNLEIQNRNLKKEIYNANLAPLKSHAENIKLDSCLDNMMSIIEREKLGRFLNRLRVEESEDYVRLLEQKIQNLEDEEEENKARINEIESILRETQHERSNLVQDALSVQDNLDQECCKYLIVKSDFDNVRNQLLLHRIENKKLESEVKTLLDMFAFYKKVYAEEKEHIKNSIEYKQQESSDLNQYYKDELQRAIQQIRQDFHNLNNQQINEYKKFKDEELSLVIRQIDKQREDLSRFKNHEDQKIEIEMAELRNFNDEKGLNSRLSHRLEDLSERHVHLINCKANKFNQLDSEIQNLRQQIEMYSQEICKLNNVERGRLENEIQFYKSLLLLGNNNKQAIPYSKISSIVIINLNLILSIK
jgi:hypothetical protein